MRRSSRGRCNRQNTSGLAFPGILDTGFGPFVVRALKVVSSADCCVNSSRNEDRCQILF